MGRKHNQEITKCLNVRFLSQVAIATFYAPEALVYLHAYRRILNVLSYVGNIVTLYVEE